MPVLHIIGTADGSPHPNDDTYVVDYDPKINGLDRDGWPWCHLVVTKDRAEAKQFPSALEALKYWRMDTGTLRPDGKPDRPLTAFTVEIA